VIFPSNVTVNLGNELTPTQVKDEPHVEWPVTPGSLYTLAMVDPDAPSHVSPLLRSIKHWLVVNIPDGDLKSGQILAGFISSGPPKGSGIHRYVILVYKQSKRIEGLTRDDTIEHRLNFNITEFAHKYELGEPVSGNFYHAQWDEYVDIHNVDMYFRSSGLVPDVIDVSPREQVKVTFPENITISLGNEITPAEASKEPHVEWAPEQNALYTLAMVDPDAPSRVTPVWRSYKHWLVMNIPAGQVSGGDIVAGYTGPAPPEGTGLHRYAILIYQQPDGHIDPPPRDDSLEHRPYFSIEDFARNYTLGEPVAGNFFLAQHQKLIY
ncbi:unnamed protein product, partial [Oppiella nova]